jgi:NitT/TauT family transport system ATP-binding protein
LAEVGLAGFERLYPSQLSGGMQQRAELARVLINEPRVLLMDEPFGALDALTRVKMQTLLLEVASRVQVTILFVTHDIDEALFLADRVVIMSARPGRVRDMFLIDEPRPRKTAWIGSEAFQRLRQRCLETLAHALIDPPLRHVSPG